MDTRAKVKILSPKTKNMSGQQQAFLLALESRLDRANVQIAAEHASSANILERYDGIRDCDGVIILAFSQWEARRLEGNSKKSVVFPSEFTHIGMAQTLLSGRPFLMLRQKSVSERGALRRGYVHPVIDLPNSLDASWLNSDGFARELEKWLKEVNSRCHVFLGYSSQATEVANKISKFLTEKLKLRVFDWHNFRATDSIWDSIERAEQLTNCGIFLFMADDVVKVGKNSLLAPRDNVVYEAGYFAGAKKRSRSLVIREKDAKIPSDFGGIIYLTLESRLNIADIETSLSTHIERMLTEGD
jgi:hypothetical protein